MLYFYSWIAKVEGRSDLYGQDSVDLISPIETCDTFAGICTILRKEIVEKVQKDIPEITSNCIVFTAFNRL